MNCDPSRALRCALALLVMGLMSCGGSPVRNAGQTTSSVTVNRDLPVVIKTVTGEFEPGKYQVLDYVNDKDLGTIEGAKPKLNTEFSDRLLLEVHRL